MTRLQTPLAMDGGVQEPKSNRKRKLTPAQLAHKREADRRAQRSSREKTRGRIAHLEELVETLQAKDGDRTKALINQIDQQKEEISRLQNVVSSVAKLVGEPSGANSLQDPVSRTTGEADGKCSAVDSELAGRPLKAEVSEPSATPRVFSVVSTPQTTTGGSAEHQAIIPTRLWMQPPRESITQMASDIFNNTRLEGRMWYVAGSILQHILATTDASQISMENDEDIAIRAVFEGWSAVVERSVLRIPELEPW